MRGRLKMGELIKANSLQLGGSGAGGRGILIFGAAGAGKSALTLALLERAALFGRAAALIGDDYTEISAKGGQLMAAASPNIAGVIEIRGAGLFSLPYKDKAVLHLAVELGGQGERYPAGHFWHWRGAAGSADESGVLGGGDAGADLRLPLLKLPPAGRADIFSLCRAVEAALFDIPYKGDR